MELYNEIDHINGLLNNDSQEDLCEDDKQPDIVPNPEIQDQVDKPSDQLTDSVPISTSLSQNKIDTNQEMVEEQLNFEKDPIILVKNKDSDSVPEGSKR